MACINEIKEGALLGLGNLLMDMVVTVRESVLGKYNLDPDSITLADETKLPLFNEISSGVWPVKYIPGGSAVNTIRVAQWILRSCNATTFMGAVGNDDEAVRLMSMLESEGINLNCQKVTNSSTGRCAVLITGNRRTLVTQLGAALKFKFDQFMNSGKFALEKSEVIYISGYFLRVCPRTCMEVAKIGSLKGFPVVLNLNAVWVVNICNRELKKILPYVSYLIGNGAEAYAFTKLCGCELENLFEISKWIAQFPRKNSVGSRVVMITRGEEHLIVTRDNEVTEYPIYEVSNDRVIDTNGAGDAYVGGFLAGLVQRKSLDSCIHYGLWAAAQIIQQVGCTLPLNSTFDYIDKLL